MVESWWIPLLLLVNPAQAEEPLPVHLVGVLTQQYQQKCTGKNGTEAEWVDPHFEIGFSPVEAGSGVALEGLVGQPVVALVQVVKGKSSAIPPKGEAFAHTCEPMQMRSDWIPAKEGIRMLRSLKAGTRWRGLQVTAVRKIQPVQLTKSGPDAVAVVTNDLGIPLEGVDLVFHYEGCHGKPGTATEVREVGALKVDESREVKAPLVVERERTRGETRGMAHILVSVQLVTSSKGVVIDLDLPLSYWHLPLECPER